MMGFRQLIRNLRCEDEAVNAASFDRTMIANLRMENQRIHDDMKRLREENASVLSEVASLDIANDALTSTVAELVDENARLRSRVAELEAVTVPMAELLPMYTEVRIRHVLTFCIAAYYDSTSGFPQCSISQGPTLAAALAEAVKAKNQQGESR